MSASSDPIGWLLLRDGHAVPLHGLSPDDLKRSRREAVQVPGLNLKHTTGLKAIVGMLGFKGDFGDYKNTHWPGVQAFMREHGLRERADHFDLDLAVVDLFAGERPTRRGLADRLFVGGSPLPAASFTGYGVNFEEWSWRRPGALMGLRSYYNEQEPTPPSDLDEAREWVVERRMGLRGHISYLGDVLLRTGSPPNLDRVMYRMEPEDETWSALVARGFRDVMERFGVGWVDIVPFSEDLAFLRAADGTWDLVWRDLRSGPPTEEIPEAGWGGLPPVHQPSWLAAEPQFKRWLYMRRGHWDERVQHDAETRYYDRGGEAGDAYPGTDELVRRFLVEEGIDMAPATSALPRKTEDIPAGFTRVSTPNGTSIGVSPLVTVADFMAVAEETGWLQDRKGEDLAKANPAGGDLPAGVTWHDAVAYSAWMERKLGVQVRLLTREEHRALRPFPSEHYSNMAQADFPWENWPPRHGLESALRWSEPRFLEAGPDRPEFPHPSGASDGGKSRKRWIRDFPPAADWVEPILWAIHDGIDFIDAWDAYEWVLGPWNWGYTAGLYWEGQIGLTSWGAYKNCKVGFRVVVELAVDSPAT